MELKIKNQTIHPESIYIRADDISGTIVESGVALYSPDTFKEKYLNHTALFIWEKLSGENIVQSIAESIADNFDSVPVEDVQVDILNLIKDLRE